MPRRLVGFRYVDSSEDEREREEELGGYELEADDPAYDNKPRILPPTHRLRIADAQPSNKASREVVLYRPMRIADLHDDEEDEGEDNYDYDDSFIAPDDEEEEAVRTCLSEEEDEYKPEEQESDSSILRESEDYEPEEQEDEHRSELVIPRTRDTPTRQNQRKSGESVGGNDDGDGGPLHHLLARERVAPSKKRARVIEVDSQESLVDPDEPPAKRYQFKADPPKDNNKKSEPHPKPRAYPDTSHEEDKTTEEERQLATLRPGDASRLLKKITNSFTGRVKMMKRLGKTLGDIHINIAAEELWLKQLHYISDRYDLDVPTWASKVSNGSRNQSGRKKKPRRKNSTSDDDDCSEGEATLPSVAELLVMMLRGVADRRSYTDTMNAAFSSLNRDVSEETDKLQQFQEILELRDAMDE